MSGFAPAPETSDADLLAMAARGDHAAFGVLVARRQAGVYRLARVLARDDTVAEEIAQEAFVRLYFHAADVRSASAWLSRTVMNLVKDHIRMRIRNDAFLINAGSEPHRPDSPETPDVGLERAEERAVIQRALAQLPPELTEVLQLRYYADLRYEEIADTLGLPLGTVCTRLRRGLRELAIHLNTNTVRGTA